MAEIPVAERNKENMVSKDWFQVSKKLLPLKLHFFFMAGGFAGIAPFKPLIAKQIGINATAVGVGFSLIPVFVLLTQPVFGLLVDYFQNLKFFLISLILISSLSYISVLFIPPIEPPSSNVYIRVVKSNASEHIEHLSKLPEENCFEDLVRKGVDCRLMSNKSTYCDNLNLVEMMCVVPDYTLSADNKPPDKIYWIAFSIVDKAEANCHLNSSDVFDLLPTLSTCLFKDETSSVYYTPQFWVFVLLAIVGGITYISEFTLSSAAVLEVLDNNIQAYGRQRLFGTLSWGLVCPLAGLLNDIVGHGEKTYAPGIYLMVAFFIIDIFILCVIQVPKANLSKNMCSDLGKIFASFEILIFAFGATATGILNSIIGTYELWFLQDIGASQFLLGLTGATKCLLGELPFLFFSGWIVNKLGPFLCLVTVFAAYALRMGFYSILADPWVALPIDILQGITFGIKHAVIVSYAKVKAPKGMETTLLSILIGLYDGLGACIGNFLGGIAMDNLGPRLMFSYASFTSVGAILIFLVASYCFRSQTEQEIASETVEAVQLLPCRCH